MDEKITNTEEAMENISDVVTTDTANRKLLIVGGAAILVTGLVIVNRKRIKNWWHDRKATSMIVDDIINEYSDSEEETESNDI